MFDWFSDPELLREAVACPTCLRTELVEEHDARIHAFIGCNGCGAIFPIEHATPHLVDIRTLVRLPHDLFAAWHVTQERATPLYEADDAANCSNPAREDVRAFRRFMNLESRDVLDIGSGSFALPGYLHRSGPHTNGRGYRRVIGVDPIPPRAEPPFPLVVAIGERLPFRDDAFDTVILATSLDHALDVDSLLGEAHRTLRLHGEVYCWVGLLENERLLGPEPAAPLLPRRGDVDSPSATGIDGYVKARDEYARRVREVEERPELVEETTVDEYHFRHFNRHRLLEAFSRSGFWPATERSFESVDGAHHLFVRAVKAGPEHKAAEMLAGRLAADIAHNARPLVRLTADVTELRGELEQLRAEQASMAFTLAHLRDRWGRSLARRAKRRATRAVRTTRDVTRMSAAVARAATRPRRQPAGTRRRVVMLTISDVGHDPRIKKITTSLADAGHEIDIIAPAMGRDASEESAGESIRHVRQPRRSETFLYYQEEFREAALAREFDVVHAHDLTTLTVGWTLARERGVPLVYDAHELWAENVEFNGAEWVPMSRRTRFIAHTWERRLIRDVDLLVTVGHSIVEEFERRYELKRPPVLLPNYPSLSLLNGKPPARSIRRACGLDESTFVTLYMGGIGPLRNIESVIEAHRHLPDDHVFVVMGPGHDEYETTITAAARAAGVQDRTFVLPPVGMDEVVAAAEDADCGIVMLRNICRNFYFFYPNKLFEYALAGLPVAVSNFPDVSRFVESEHCGVTFDPEVPESIAAALASLSRDRERARAMGERGRASIVGRHNWEAAVVDLLAAYEGLGE